MKRKQGPPTTFATFLPTAGSHEALEGARAIASGAAAHRLLLLWGPPGVGKTHLLRAIVHRAQSGKRAADSILTTATEWQQDLVRALRLCGAVALTVDHAKAATVVIDDLHVLAGMPVTQDRLARELRELVEAGTRVAVACGCSPARLEALTEKVAGLAGARLVEMRQPDGLEMARILTSLAAASRVRLSTRRVLSLASECGGDPRRAAGQIARLRLERSLVPLPHPPR